MSNSKSPTQTLRPKINPHPVHLQVTNTNTKVKNQSTSCPSTSHQHKHLGQESINIVSISNANTTIKNHSTSPAHTLMSRINQHTVHLQVTNANTKDKNQPTSCLSPSHQRIYKGKESIHILSMSKSSTQTLRSRINPHPVHLQVSNANTQIKNQSTSYPSPSH